MLRASAGLASLLLAACGGGGAAVVVPGQTPARLTAAGAEIGPFADSVEVLVQLAAVPADPVGLLQVAIELPPGLTLPATARLRPARDLVTLDGDMVGDRFVVTCGDARNVQAAPLTAGPLFWLRLQPTSPRQPGTWTVRLSGLRAAASAGAAVPAETNPATVAVVVR